MRVLFMANPGPTAESLTRMIKRAGHDVEVTHYGEDGIGLAIKHRGRYDAILFEDALLDMSVPDVIRRLRLSRTRTPIVVVLGPGHTQAQMERSGPGADTYVTMPVRQGRLMMRIIAVTKRKYGQLLSVRIGNLVVTYDTKMVTVGGDEIQLAPKEYDVLELLARRAGVFVTRQDILVHLYGRWGKRKPGIVPVLVCNLRKKIAASNGRVLIRALRDSGYRISWPD